MWGVLRKGKAFPQVRRRSRKWWPTEANAIWTRWGKPLPYSLSTAQELERVIDSPTLIDR